MASSNQPENPTNAKMNSFQQYATTKNYDDDRGLLKIEEAEDDMYSYPTFLQQNQHSNLRRRRKRQHNKKQSQLHQERHLRHHPRSYGQRSYHRKSRANQVVSGWVRVARACMNAILSTSKKIFRSEQSKTFDTPYQSVIMTINKDSPLKLLKMQRNIYLKFSLTTNGINQKEKISTELAHS